MKIFTLILTAILVINTTCFGYDPTEVNGVVTVLVDRKTPVWKVTITNQSKEKLTYEMMGAVPRGLGIEFWNDDGQCALIHADDLAEYLGVDGFPADLRDLEPGKSVTFNLNLSIMSSNDIEAMKKWKEEYETGYFKCRVFFGVYASRMLSVSPTK